MICLVPFVYQRARSFPCFLSEHSVRQQARPQTGEEMRCSSAAHAKASVTGHPDNHHTPTSILSNLLSAFPVRRRGEISIAILGPQESGLTLALAGVEGVRFSRRP